MKELAARILELAVALALAAWLLSLAWGQVRPLVPVLVTIGASVIVLRIVQRRRNGW